MKERQLQPHEDEYISTSSSYDGRCTHHQRPPPWTNLERDHRWCLLPHDIVKAHWKHPSTQTPIFGPQRGTTRTSPWSPTRPLTTSPRDGTTERGSPSRLDPFCLKISHAIINTTSVYPVADCTRHVMTGTAPLRYRQRFR